MSRTTSSAKRADRAGGPPLAKAARQLGKPSIDLGGMDWDAFHAMTDEEVIARALKDPDNLPLTDADFARMKRRPRAYIIRRALRMTQEEFAEAFRIPIGTLRDWEQGRTEPDQASRAYLWVIAVDPEYVRRALALRPAETMSGAR